MSHSQVVVNLIEMLLEWTDWQKMKKLNTLGIVRELSKVHGVQATFGAFEELQSLGYFEQLEKPYTSVTQSDDGRDYLEKVS